MGRHDDWLYPEDRPESIIVLIRDLNDFELNKLKLLLEREWRHDDDEGTAGVPAKL